MAVMPYSKTNNVKEPLIYNAKIKQTDQREYKWDQQVPIGIK